MLVTSETKPQSDDENGCLKQGPENRVWKFVHEKDYSYRTELLKGRECNFNWLKISKDGTITVKGSYYKGYAWDGCTPKFNCLHITWGICDGQLIQHIDEMTGKKSYKPCTYYASMIHDVIYQYKRCAPVTRKEADMIFYELLKKSGFMWSWIYYAGVRSFGWIFKGWHYKK
jgi:hypothetical protein